MAEKMLYSLLVILVYNRKIKKTWNKKINWLKLKIKNI